MSLLYRGGLLVTEGPALPKPLAHASDPPEDLLERLDAWRAERFGRYVVRFDETWPCARVERPRAAVLLLGTAVHVDRPELDDQDVAELLADAAEQSWQAFVEALDLLGGAHLVFVRRGGRTRVVQDATGVEALCYDVFGGPRLLASHPALIAELRGYEESDLARWWLTHPRIGAGGFYFPGLRTVFDEVRILTPNTSLDLGTLAVERFFPRTEAQLLPLEQIVESTAPRLQNQFRRLVRTERVAVSLSGGIDTRLTLAAAREVASDVRWFTYSTWGSGVHRHDCEVGEQLAQRLNLPHETWRLARDRGRDPEVGLLWRRMHRGAQGNDAIANGLLPHFPAGHLHVRSNVLEIARGFYLKNPGNRAPGFDAEKLSRLFRSATAGRFEPYFAEFCGVTGFSPAALHGLHYADLFYWEHRMGAWHGGMVRGHKLVHRTYTLYNCRAILTTMLARPLRQRVKAAVVWALMESMWPEVLETPIYSGSAYVDRPDPRRWTRMLAGRWPGRTSRAT